MSQAIQRNRARSKRYQELTGGESKRVTRALILVERAVMPIGWYFDMRARQYQQAGIPVLCDELISLYETPEFRDYVPPVGDVPESFQSVGAKELSKVLARALKSEGWDRVGELVDAKLAEIAVRPSFHCLLRNDLETIRRSVLYAKRHNEMAQTLGVNSPDRLSRLFVRAMIRGLRTVEKIDEIAFPIQKMGVPIICQDFPGVD